MGYRIQAFPNRIFRLSDAGRDYDAKHLEAVRASLAQCMEVLRSTPSADTFAGRKTQEPFPDGLPQAPVEYDEIREAVLHLSKTHGR